MSPASAGLFSLQLFLCAAKNLASTHMNETSRWPCLRTEASGKGKQARTRVVLDTSVSPNAPRTEVTGWHDGALRVRLAAPPVDGAANDALRKWLAQQLGLTQSQVELVRGQTSRRKQWALDIDEAAACRWLAGLPTLQK
jgi:uncharacterized protein